MRARLIFVLTVVVLGLAVPGAANASVTYRPVPSQTNELGSPVSPVNSMTTVPLGFSTDGTQAVHVAEHAPAMLALHRREHPLTYVPYVWHLGGLYWYLIFSYRGNVVAEVNVSTTGKLDSVWTGPQAIAPYARGHYAPGFDRWWVILASALLFVLPFLDPRRWRRLLHLDALVIVSWLASYLLLDHAHLQSAVWLAYPPLVYLLVRMLWVGFRGRSHSDRLAPLFSTKALIAGLLLIVAGRVALSLLAGQEIDVGYASVLGGHRIAQGLPLYFPDPGHGDTYGPITYLAYLPFDLLFGVSRSWTTHMWPADIASTTFDLITIVALFFLGRRLRAGERGTRLGLVMAWAWAACPFTLLGLMVHTNDGLVAMLSALSLLVFASAPARGALLGLAVAAKFSPAALLPLYARKRKDGLKGSLAVVGAAAGIVILAVALYLPPGGLSEFYHRTLGYQLTRPDVFSPWALHPALDPIKIALEAGAVLLAGLVAFFPRGRADRSLAQVSALAAAVTIAVQLPAVHWFYFYIVWFLPFVLVALLGPRDTSTSEPGITAAGEPALLREPDVSEQVLVGV